MKLCKFCGTKAVEFLGKSNCRNCGANPTSQNSGGVIPRLLLATDIATNWGTKTPNIEIISAYEKAAIEVSDTDIKAAKQVKPTTTISNNLWFWYSNGLQMIGGATFLLVGAIGMTIATTSFLQLRNNEMAERFTDTHASLLVNVQSLQSEIDEIQSTSQYSSLPGLNVLITNVNSDIDLAGNVLSTNAPITDSILAGDIDDTTKQKIAHGLRELRSSTEIIQSHDPTRDVIRAQSLSSDLDRLHSQSIDPESHLFASHAQTMNDTSAYLDRFELNKAKSSLDDVKRILQLDRDIGLAKTELNDKLNRVEKVAVSRNAHESIAQARRKLEISLNNGGEALDDVRELIEQLEAVLNDSYSLRVVNRPGVKSGVWRYPDDNPDERSYYLVVESARDPNTKRYILNEETRSYDRVDHWAIRVSERTYEMVKQDKIENGIVDDDHVGTKEVGYLQPVYAIPSTGGSITKW